MYGRQTTVKQCECFNCRIKIALEEKLNSIYCLNQTINQLFCLTLFRNGTTLNGKNVTNALSDMTKNLIIVSEHTTIHIKFHVSILCMLVGKNIKLFKEKLEFVKVNLKQKIYIYLPILESVVSKYYKKYAHVQHEKQNEQDQFVIFFFILEN